MFFQAPLSGSRSPHISTVSRLWNTRLLTPRESGTKIQNSCRKAEELAVYSLHGNFHDCIFLLAPVCVEPRPWSPPRALPSRTMPWPRRWRDDFQQQSFGALPLGQGLAPPPIQAIHRWKTAAAEDVSVIGGARGRTRIVEEERVAKASKRRRLESLGEGARESSCRSREGQGASCQGTRRQSSRRQAESSHRVRKGRGEGKPKAGG